MATTTTSTATSTTVTTLLPWELAVARKRAEVSRRIPPEWRLPSALLQTVADETAALDVTRCPAACGLLTGREVEITEQYDAVALAEKIASKVFTSFEVALAFCKRAAIAGQLTNCLTEIFFDEALDRAKYLDTYLEKKGKPLGPLHGLPISLKDSFHVKGIQSSIGYVSFLDHAVADSNAPLVDMLLAQGAVLYVKTNIPQTLMLADSINNVFGRVLNPRNISLTAGGSTGGEAALIAIGGSILGVGTDIAGSVRIPALCCGVFGFRPSTGRIPSTGHATPGKATHVGIRAVVGPLARSARDLRLFMETVLRAEPWRWDMEAQKILWTPHPQPQQPRSLRIGLIVECPSWPVASSVKETLNSAATRLARDGGHTIISLDRFPHFDAAMQLCWQLFDLDNDLTSLKNMEASGEPQVKALMDLYSPVPGGRPPRRLEDVFEMDAQRMQVASKWHRIFVDNELDVLLAPGSQYGTAVPHDTYGAPPYTAMWNLVDYPACVIPVLEADSCDVTNHKISNGGVQPSRDAPRHIQIVAPPYHDEQLMEAVELIDGILR